MVGNILDNVLERWVSNNFLGFVWGQKFFFSEDLEDFYEQGIEQWSL